MNIKRFNRRHFLVQGITTLTTTVLLKGCKRRIERPATNHATNSGIGDNTLSLQSLSIPPANGKAPQALIVCLHGFGANAEDLAPFAPALKLADYQFLFPNAPYPHPSISGGRMWYDLYSPHYQGLAKSRQNLIDWLNSLESSTSVPLSRTILSGFSQGGAMTLDVGLTLPLAGLISLSGYVHSTLEPAVGQSLPSTLIVHGRQDQVVPLSAAHQVRETLTALSVSVKYHEFNMGHEITPAVVELMRSFVLDCLA